MNFSKTAQALQQLRMKTVGNGRKTPLLFSIFIFKYEHENGVGNENESEITVFENEQIRSELCRKRSTYEN